MYEQKVNEAMWMLSRMMDDMLDDISQYKRPFEPGIADPEDVEVVREAMKALKAVAELAKDFDDAVSGGTSMSPKWLQKVVSKRRKNARKAMISKVDRTIEVMHRRRSY